MAKNATQTAYGTELTYTKLRSNHPIKSKYMAAALCMLFGAVGANQFYLHNFVKGILKILLTAVCIVLDVLGLFPFPFIAIPFALSAVTGLLYLAKSDVAFAKKNKVRIV